MWAHLYHYQRLLLILVIVYILFMFYLLAINMYFLIYII